MKDETAFHRLVWFYHRFRIFFHLSVNAFRNKYFLRIEFFVILLSAKLGITILQDSKGANRKFIVVNYYLLEL